MSLLYFDVLYAHKVVSVKTYMFYVMCKKEQIQKALKKSILCKILRTHIEYALPHVKYFS
jgi:hypothetical protein